MAEEPIEYKALEKQADDIIERLTGNDSFSLNVDPTNAKLFQKDVELLERAAIKDDVPISLKFKAERISSEYVRAMGRNIPSDEILIWNLSCPNNCGFVKVYAARNGVKYYRCSKSGSEEKNTNCVIPRLCERL